MPFRERLGLYSQGKSQDRGMGFCFRGKHMNSEVADRFGRGRGRRCLEGFGRRFRRFWRMRFFAGASSREEMELLKEEEEILKKELEAGQKRLAEIEKSETR